jgi:hypothetical protein
MAGQNDQIESVNDDVPFKDSLAMPVQPGLVPSYGKPGQNRRPNVPSTGYFFHEHVLIMERYVRESIIESGAQQVGCAKIFHFRDGENVWTSALVHCNQRFAEMRELELERGGVAREPGIEFPVATLCPAIVVIVEEIFHVPEAK